MYKQCTVIDNDVIWAINRFFKKTIAESEEKVSEEKSALQEIYLKALEESSYQRIIAEQNFVTHFIIIAGQWFPYIFMSFIVFMLVAIAYSVGIYISYIDDDIDRLSSFLSEVWKVISSIAIGSQSIIIFYFLKKNGKNEN